MSGKQTREKKKKNNEQEENILEPRENAVSVCSDSICTVHTVHHTVSYTMKLYLLVYDKYLKRNCVVERDDIVIVCSLMRAS